MSLRFGFRRFVSAQKCHREAQVAQQILGMAKGGEDRAGFSLPQANSVGAVLSCPHSLDFQPPLYLGLFIISHVLTGTSRYKKQLSSSPKKKKNPFASMQDCLLSLLNPTHPQTLPCTTYFAREKGILHLQVISQVLLLFSPLQEGFREYIQKDVFVPPLWVSVPRLPIKLSHKSSIIGSKT